MVASSKKCYRALGKNCGKAKPVPRAMSPLEGGHRSQVFVVTTQRGISSPTGEEHKQPYSRKPSPTSQHSSLSYQVGLLVGLMQWGEGG